MADPTAKFVLTAEDRTARAFASADRNLKTISRTANSVRSMFGVLGVAVSGRMFAGWIAGAVRAADATGEHAEQIKATKAAMDGLKKASDELALSIGRSLTPAMRGLSAVMIGWNRIISGADPFEFEAQIEGMRRKLSQLQAQFNAGYGMPKDLRDKLIQDIADTEKAIDGLIKKQRQARGLDMGPEFRQNVEMRRAVESMNRIGDAYERFGDIRGALDGKVMQRPELKLDELLLPDDLQDIKAGNGESLEIPLSAQLMQIDPDEVKKLFAPIKKEARLTAESLGLNFKDAFDSWLIDGERGFGELMRRMAIMAATSELFSLLGTFFGGMTGGAASFASKFFGGSRASTGSVRGGMMYKVHEGEAFFKAGSDGHVGKTGGRPSISIGYVDARGATDPAAVEAAVHRGVLTAVSINDARTDAKLNAFSRPAMA